MGFLNVSFFHSSNYFFFFPEELLLKLLLKPFVACGTFPFAILRGFSQYPKTGGVKKI
jgi:hypothetical protein